VDPPILLMDEPFGALDPMTRAELHREFHRIQARVRKTIVIVTHDMGEAFALADRIGVVDEGRLVACEAPSAIARSRDPQVRQLLDAMPGRVDEGRFASWRKALADPMPEPSNIEEGVYAD